jgi:hypothetical protein
MNTWFLAYFKAAAATSISFFKALVNPQTVAFFTILLISETDKKSPGLETEIQPQLHQHPFHPIDLL